MEKFPVAFMEKEELIVWCREHLSIEEKRKIHSDSAKNLRLRAVPVFVFDAKGKTIGEFPSLRATAKELDVSVAKVSSTIKNKSKLYGMFYISNHAKLKFA